MKNINPEIQEAQQTWGGMNENKSTLRHVIRNLLETSDENKILEAKQKDTLHTEES